LRRARIQSGSRSGGIASKPSRKISAGMLRSSAENLSHVVELSSPSHNQPPPHLAITLGGSPRPLIKFSSRRFRFFVREGPIVIICCIASWDFREIFCNASEGKTNFGRLVAGDVGVGALSLLKRGAMRVERLRSIHFQAASISRASFRFATCADMLVRLHPAALSSSAFRTAASMRGFGTECSATFPQLTESHSSSARRYSGILGVSSARHPSTRHAPLPFRFSAPVESESEFRLFVGPVFRFDPRLCRIEAIHRQLQSQGHLVNGLLDVSNGVLTFA
jgi:hypothetical protein